MCLAIPAKIIKVNENVAVVDYGGVTRETQLDLVDAKIGDYVLIHAGFAIEVIDEKSALQSLKEIDNLIKANNNLTE